MWDCSSPRNQKKQPFPSCCGWGCSACLSFRESIWSRICSGAEDMSLSRVRAYGQWVCSVIEKCVPCYSHVSHESIGPACDYGNFVHAPPPWFARCSGQGTHLDGDVGGQVGVRGLGLHSPPGVKVGVKAELSADHCCACMPCVVWNKRMSSSV